MKDAPTNLIKPPRWSVTLEFPDGINLIVSKALSRLFKIIAEKPFDFCSVPVFYLEKAWDEIMVGCIPYPVLNEHMEWSLCYDAEKLKEEYFYDFLEAFGMMKEVFSDQIEPLSEGRLIKIYHPFFKLLSNPLEKSFNSPDEPLVHFFIYDG